MESQPGITASRDRTTDLKLWGLPVSQLEETWSLREGWHSPRLLLCPTLALQLLQSLREQDQNQVHHFGGEKLFSPIVDSHRTAGEQIVSL